MNYIFKSSLRLRWLPPDWIGGLNDMLCRVMLIKWFGFKKLHNLWNNTKELRC